VKEVLEEVIYTMKDKSKHTQFILKIVPNATSIIKMDDYEKFVSIEEVTLKQNQFITYYERYYKDGSYFNNKVLCRLDEEKMREVEQAVGISIKELFALAIEKIKKGNIRAFDGLWFLCNILNVYQQPYWTERVRKHILY
jgi:hypothetical protein